jgi:D-aminopeptidase
MTSPGPRNLITDVAGLRVGNAEDHIIKTGVTVLVADRPFVAAVDVMGGSPGTRETDLLDPDRVIDEVDALVLSGGSAFGLDAPSGVTDVLVRQGRGFKVAGATVPIVPGGILFDLQNGGDKAWGDNPYRRLGAAAVMAAREDFAMGTAGAGTGALTITLKGGLGSASLVLDTGHTVGALVAANPRGNVTVGDTAHFWAAPYEFGEEYGGLGPFPGRLSYDELGRHDRRPTIPFANTTIAIVATNAKMSKQELKRVAVAAQDGMARSISPSHSIFDGDLVFALSTGEVPISEKHYDAAKIGHAAAVCLSRAIARAIYSATPAPDDVMPTWREKFGR